VSANSRTCPAPPLTATAPPRAHPRGGLRLRATCAEVYARRELLAILVARNLKIRYKQSVLGFFWSLLGPLLLIVIYAIFAGILKFNSGRPHYLQFLVVGIVTWQFLAMCLNDSLYAVMGNANLVKKTRFPRIILPLAMVLANLANFLLSWVVLLIYLVWMRLPFEHLWLLPFVVLLQAGLCLGMSLILATANVFFRDTEHILGVGILAWFFLSPIFYPVQMQLDKLHDLGSAAAVLRYAVFLNPMTGIVWLYRRILMSTQAGDIGALLPGQLAISVGMCMLLLAVGLVVFQSCEPRFGDEL
jgi:lipopolysaccharide transport system permease protein